MKTWWILSVALIVLLTVVVSAESQNPRDASSRISSSLALLYSLYEYHPEDIPEEAKSVSDASGAGIILQLNRHPSKQEMCELSKHGLKLHNKEIRLPKGLIKSGRIPWKSIETVSMLPFVDYIDSIWQPGVAHTLDVSAQAVNAPDVWQIAGSLQSLESQSRIIIADFDTGVDVFHPALWRPDGNHYHWLDVNGNGSFDSGLDAIDINSNGAFDLGETLCCLKAQVKDYQGVITNSSGPFSAGLDWLFNDSNGNGMRDYGVIFGESKPAYGEQIFVINDANSNGGLDPGEMLVELKTSKVAAVLGAGSVTYERGVNLIQAPADTSGHGTSVCGILSSRAPSLGKYVGISPDVDILLADRSANNFTQYIPWAESRGARVMLYEFGSWTFQFMDGTSALEQAISAEWDKDIIQVIPAGNLANGNKHASAITTGAMAEFNFSVPAGRRITAVYLTVLWTVDTDYPLSFVLKNPAGTQIPLPGDQKFITDSLGNKCWSFGVQVSPRGTKRFDVYISGVTVGNWMLSAQNPDGRAIKLHAYLSDNIGGWTGGCCFLNHISTDYTVSWPATADKAIVVGSYSTRGNKVPAQSLSDFSGCGPRIDGTDIVDVCAPGNYDVFTPCSKDANNPFGSYKEFSGTSASAPHVASACALLLQLNPTLTSDQIQSLITGSAASDSFTGFTPNHSWGYGKLSIASAAQGVMNASSETAASLRQYPDGHSAALFGKLVVGVFEDYGCFYVEENDRSSGIRIIGTGVSEGDKVMVTGKMTTLGAEKALQAQTVKILQHSQVLPGPVGMLGRDAGDSRVGAKGPLNTGLLIRVWGRVVEHAQDWFTVMDGSGSYIRVAGRNMSFPRIGDFIIVTGISSLMVEGDCIIKVVLPRYQADINLDY